MRGHRAEFGLWVIALVILLTGVVTAARGGAAGSTAAGPLPVLPTMTATSPTTDELIDAVGDIRNGDLFRIERAPPDSAAAAAAAPAMGIRPAVLTPSLVLRGLVGGPPWSAIVDGIPGSDGAVVLRVGQSSGGITLRAVRRDTIILQGRDTTWKLTVRPAW